jgi:hypothetical protein
MEEPLPGDVANNNKKRNLTTAERMCCFNMLYGKWHNGLLERGSINDAAIFFDVHRNTIRALWRANLDDLSEFLSNHPDATRKDYLCNEKNFENGNSRKTGRPRKYDRDELKEATKKVPFRLRKDLRSYADAVSVPKTTLHRILKKENVLRRTCNKLKPCLTEENKVSAVCVLVGFNSTSNHRCIVVDCCLFRSRGCCMRLMRWRSSEMVSMCSRT